MKKIYVVEYFIPYEVVEIQYLSLSKEKANDVRDKIAIGADGEFEQTLDGGGWINKWKDCIITKEYNLDEVINQ